MVNSKRTDKDGCVYAGPLDPENINDITIPDEISKGQRNFVIKWNCQIDSYIIQDMGFGSGTFIKIENEH
jgi:hypothetical protein